MSRVCPIDTSGQQKCPIRSSCELPDAHYVDDEVELLNASIRHSEQLLTNAHSVNDILTREEVVSRREFDALKASHDALITELISCRNELKDTLKISRAVLKTSNEELKAFFSDVANVDSNRDADGHYLVPRSWKHFGAMLEYMRDGSCELPTGYKPTTYASTTGCGRALPLPLTCPMRHGLSSHHAERPPHALTWQLRQPAGDE